MMGFIFLGIVAWVILLAIVAIVTLPKLARAGKVKFHAWQLHREDSKIAKGKYTHVFAWMQPDGQHDLLWSERKHKFMWIRHRSQCIH